MVLRILLLIIVYLPSSIEQTVSTSISPSPSLHINITATFAMKSSIQGNATLQTVSVNVSSITPNQTMSPIMSSSSVAIISQINGTTKTKNYTFFLEFKTKALAWSADLTDEGHNTFKIKANEIVEIVDTLYTNDSTFKGSFVIGFREGGYVSVKLQFKPGGDITNLDKIIEFLRNGGGGLITDTVYLKLGSQADCIIDYVDTTVCDCLSMMYKRQITCRQPEIDGGEACPNKCSTGHVIVGATACSWDDLDAYECAAYRAGPLNLMLGLIVLGLQVYQA